MERELEKWISLGWLPGKLNVFTEEIKNKIRQKILGRKLSEETKEKLRQKALQRNRGNGTGGSALVS